MGQIVVSGANAASWLEGLLTNEVASLAPGNAHYTLMLNEQGGVIDNLLLYCLKEEVFLLVVTASCTRKDLVWLEEHLEEGITVENQSLDWAGLAVQGPQGPEIYTAITEGRTLPARNGVDDLKHEGERLLVCRTGYTGEDGFEIFCRSNQVKYWWKSLIEAGVKPCGLAARDSLRLEMCYPLNGSDLSPCRTPLEAGLGLFVDLEKGDFIGSEVLLKQQEEGCSESLMAIEVTDGEKVPQPGSAVLDEKGNALSVLTSACFSPSLGKGICLAYLPVARAKIDSIVALEVGEQRIMAQVVEKPFYQK